MTPVFFEGEASSKQNCSFLDSTKTEMEDARHGSSLVTSYNKQWSFLFTARQSLINWRQSRGYQGPYAYTTAAARTTPSKNVFLFYFGISQLFGTTECASVLKFASAEYTANAFSSNQIYEKFAVVVHVPQTTRNLVISSWFCIGRQRNVQKFITHVHSYCFAHSEVLVAVASYFCTVTTLAVGRRFLSRCHFKKCLLQRVGRCTQVFRQQRIAATVSQTNIRQLTL